MISEEFPIKEIGIGTKVASGFAFKSTDLNNESGIPVIKIGNIQNGEVTTDNSQYYPENLVNNKVEKFFLNEKDVLIAMTGQGSVGRVGQLRLNGKKALLNQRVGKFVFNDNILDRDYCYFVLSSKRYEQILFDFGTGSGQPNLSPAQIQAVKIPIPDIKIQKKISQILSSLNDKIYVLKKQNEILEEIGKTIFKQWFVDFEFPNAEGKPYKSSGGEMIESELGEIPKGWSVGTLGDGHLTKIVKPGIEKFDDERIYLDTASVQNSNVIDESTNITISERPSRANMQPKPNTVWFAKMKDSRKILFFDTFSYKDISRYILSTGFAGLEVKEYSLYYVWSYILMDRFEIEKDNLCLGTTMQAINNENILKMKIINPPKEILAKFNKIIRPLYERTYTSSQNIRFLGQTRDVLLPKLMSGKIRVPHEN